MDYFFDIKQDEYKTWCTQKGVPTFTLKQVHEWVTKKNTIDVMKMTNISKKNQTILNQHLTINPFKSIETCPASDDSATKYIFQIEPHVFIEAVAIQEKGYETLCISSQAGCPVDCKFCLTGVSGLKKKLICKRNCGTIGHY